MARMLPPQTEEQRARSARLKVLVKKSVAEFNALPWEKQEEILREQTASWVRANMPAKQK